MTIELIGGPLDGVRAVVEHVEVEPGRLPRVLHPTGRLSGVYALAVRMSELVYVWRPA